MGPMPLKAFVLLPPSLFFFLPAPVTFFVTAAPVLTQLCAVSCVRPVLKMVLGLADQGAQEERIHNHRLTDLRQWSGEIGRFWALKD